MFKNRFLIIPGVLSLLLVAMVISFPLSNTPTSAERGRAADATRWTAMGEYYQRHPELTELSITSVATTTLDECYDVSLSEVAACREASQAPSR